METTTLQVAADSPWFLHAGAALLLFAHIAGGTVAMLAGAAALALRKGSRRHALAGRAFFVAMLAMTAIGAGVAPFLVSPQGDPRWFDSLAGAFTLYLAATGWMTVRRRPGTIGRFERAACAYAALLAATALSLGLAAAGSPAGAIGGYPPGSYFTFAAIFMLAALLDLNMIRRGGLAGVPRLARHLWRMCLALFVALGSFFLGQQRVMPEAIQGSTWLSVPPLAALALMVFWLLRLRLARPIARLRARLARRRLAPSGAPLG